MIPIKTTEQFQTMREAGRLLAHLYDEILASFVQPGVSTGEIDGVVDMYLKKHNLQSQTKGYCGYRHVSCIALNDEVVHGVPSPKRTVNQADIVTVDVCAAWNGYCADMARTFVMPQASLQARRLVEVAYLSLDAGIAAFLPGNRLGDVSSAVQAVIEGAGYSVVRDFAGHGIGKSMHEDPELLNYGTAGTGPLLEVGMAFAIEPMLTIGSPAVYIGRDGWTVKTISRSLAAHVEDTVLITENGPEIITRLQKCTGIL